MNRKIAAIAVAAACVIGCAFALTGCGKNDPYYDRTYTLTGTASIDWTKKNHRDLYTDDSKEISAKEVLERHWDDIDWAKTAEANGGTESDLPAHESFDGFIDGMNEMLETLYKSYAGLKISISDKDAMTLTLTLPAVLAEALGASELTMPFAETEAQFEEITPHAELDFGTYINEGYHCMGIYAPDDSDSFLTVTFSVEEYVNKIWLSITQYTVVGGEEASHMSDNILFSNGGFALTLCDAEGNLINTFDFILGFEVAKN